MAKRDKNRQKKRNKANNNNESETETQVRIIKQINKKNEYTGSESDISDEENDDDSSDKKYKPNTTDSYNIPLKCDANKMIYHTLKRKENS